MVTPIQFNYGFISASHWDIANDSGQSSVYTHVNALVEPEEKNDNFFGNEVMKVDAKHELFERLKATGMKLRSPLPCDLQFKMSTGSKRKAKPLCTDIVVSGQSIMKGNVDLQKLPNTLSDFTSVEQLQGATLLADQVEYDMMDIRIVPLRILYLQTFHIDGNTACQAYIASVDPFGHKNPNNFGFLITKMSAHHELVPRLKHIVKPTEYNLKPFECIGICYPKRGKEEADTMYLADIFYQGAFLLRSTPPMQKKS